MLRISSVAEQLLALQEGLGSMEVIRGPIPAVPHKYFGMVFN
jgi:hypothetical protein